MLRRNLLMGVSASALLITTAANPAPIGGIVLPTVSGGGSGVMLATLTLTNVSGSTQAANFVSPIFGWVFKKGDIPTGSAPQFKISNVTQPFSWGCQSYWSDGSLKFASFMLRSGTSIAGSGSLSVEVWSGGSAPSTSARTLIEVYNQLIQVNAAAAPISNAFISGTWNAVLANNANNLEQVVYLDGAAGKVWRILTNFVQSGSAHGQMVAYHYIAALTDSGGNLGGFRYLPCVTQPWYDINSPTKNWRALSTLNWQYGAGPTATAFPLPQTSGTFSGVPGTGRFSASSGVITNWSLGTDQEPVVPGYLTTTGALPTVSFGDGNQLDVNTLYFMYVEPGGTNTDLGPYSNSTHVGGQYVSTSTGTGTNTFVPCYALMQFCRLYGGTVDAKWNFLQGSGSISADNTVRTKIDQTYWVSSKAIPPFNLSLIGSVSDNTSTQDYNVQAVGPVVSYFGQTGDRGDIGPVSIFSARHFYNQTVLSEKIVRLIGLSSGNEAYCFRDSTTKQIVNLSSNTFSGMMAGNTGLGWSVVAGFTGPKHGVTNVYTENGTSHQPELIAWAYVVYGEPQMLDMLAETGNGAVLQMYTPAQRNPSLPVALTGITTGFEQQQRTLSWATRNINLSGGYMPATMPDGSAAASYLRARAAASNQHMLDIWNSTTMNSYCTSTGFWTFVDPGSSALTQSGWQRTYTISAVCMGAALLEDANCLTLLSSVFAAWYSHCLATFGGWCVGSYYEVSGTGNGATSNELYPVISADAQWAPRMPLALFNWPSGSDPTFTLTPIDLSGWTPANNDKYIFFDDPHPAGLSKFTPYYAASVSGNTFKLRTAPSGGGSAVTTSNTGTCTGDQVGMVPAADIPGTVNFSGVTQNQIIGVSRWGKALLGTSAFDAVITDMLTRLAHGPEIDPQWAFQGNF